MKSINFTLAPLALLLASCAANHPAANVPPAAGTGTHTSSGTRSTGSNRSSHGGGDSASGSSASGATGSRKGAGSRGAYADQGGDVAQDGNSGQGRSAGQGGNAGQGGSAGQGDNARQGGAQQKNSAVLGSWSGNDGQQKISVKFGANGSLLINNAAGANPGQWSGGSGGRFRIQVGAYNGEFVMVNAKTGSLTLGDSSVELKR